MFYKGIFGSEADVIDGPVHDESSGVVVQFILFLGMGGAFSDIHARLRHSMRHNLVVKLFANLLHASLVVVLEHLQYDAEYVCLFPHFWEYLYNNLINKYLE